MPTYYETLGVTVTASQDDIKAAFWKLAKVWHPDKATGNAEKFKHISEAYNCLSDPAKRRSYDDKPKSRGGNAETSAYSVTVNDADKRRGFIIITSKDFTEKFRVTLHDVDYGSTYVLTHGLTKRKIEVTINYEGSAPKPQPKREPRREESNAEFYRRQNEMLARKLREIEERMMARRAKEESKQNLVYATVWGVIIATFVVFLCKVIANIP